MNSLSDLRNMLRLEPSVRDEFLMELNTHYEEKYQELIESGLPPEQAKEQALKSLGSPKLIAKQIYEVYSQGTWKQAIFAAFPHLLIALFFALHFMPDLIWLAVLSILCIATVIYGWLRGKPDWLFPWLGYLLIPSIITSVLLIYLPAGQIWFAALIYIPLAILILITIVKQTLKRDWLFVSLMLLPIPIVLGWLFSFSIENRFITSEHFYKTGSWIALSFAILALSVVMFIRVKRRWQKILILLVPEILIIAIVVLTSDKAINSVGWLLLSLMAIGLIFGPAIIERQFKLRK